MKVLVVLTYYHPHWTGLTQYAVAIAEGLAQRGNDVTVVTVKHQPGLKERERINGVQVIRRLPLFKISRSLISTQLWVTAAKLIRENEVVVGFLPLAEALWTAAWAKLWGKRMYWVYNGDLVLPSGLVNRAIELIYYLMTAGAMALGDGVIINTTDYAKHSRLLVNFESKWEVILPPMRKIKIDRKYLSELKKAEGEEEQRVGFVGRWVEEKGFDVLLKAIGMVTRQRPKTVFWFAGETNVGYEKTFEKNEELIERCGQSLKMFGLLPRNKLGSFYKMLDILVISSRSDFFPMAQVEAMMAGVPVVVTYIPGARWLVKTTGAGEVVEKENPAGLAQGIIKVLKNLPDYKQKTSQAAKLFDYNTLMNQYQKLLGGKKNAHL